MRSGPELDEHLLINEMLGTVLLRTDAYLASGVLLRKRLGDDVSPLVRCDVHALCTCKQHVKELVREMSKSIHAYRTRTHYLEI
jgi:hypothetical protein